LKTDFKNPTLRKVGLTLLFYLVSGISIYLMDKSMPSGPCTPGLGMLAFMFLPIVSLVLLLINSFKIYKGDKTNIFSALLHLLFIIGLLCT
jgi:hypothetical protein